MTFGLFVRKNKKKIRFTSIATFSLPTHSQIVNGNPVETCRPYPCDYMSEALLIYSNYTDGMGVNQFFFCKKRMFDKSKD